MNGDCRKIIFPIIMGGSKRQDAQKMVKNEQHATEYDEYKA